MKLILNQAPIDGGSGTPAPASPPADWTAGLPDELRATASAKGWKSPADMGQAYIGAVKLIGNNMERPKPDWDEKKWDEFYKVAGRPETPDKYEFDLGKAKDKVDEGRIGKWREIMHKTGLSAKQAKALMETYINEEMSASEAIDAAHRQEREAAETKLREKWGTKYEDHLKLALAGIKRLGPEFEQFVTNTALGNRPELIELFHAIGSRVGEDTARPGGSGGGGGTNDPASALAEIGKLSADQQFWGALNDRFNPGHKAALDRWTELHRVAHGTAPVPSA